MNAPAASNVPAALALMLAGVLAIAGMDVLAKMLAEGVPLAQIVWARFAFSSLWMTPAVLWLAAAKSAWTRAHFGRRALAGHGVRGLLIVSATAMYFTAIADNPIPDALAAFFLEPVFVMLLAAWLLGEQLRRRRLIAALSAFLGVIIVLRPGGGHYEPSILLAPLSGLAFAGYIIATRASSMRGSPLLTAWGTALAAAVISLPVAAWAWTTQDAGSWRLLALMGLLAATGHFLVAWACRLAAAGVVAIFHYSEIIAAAALSFVFFGHVPDAAVWAGFALIAGAKIAVVLLEARERKQNGDRPPDAQIERALD